MFTRIAFGKVGYVRLLRCIGICLERADEGVGQTKNLL